MDNTEARRYEFKINGFVPRVEYIKTKDKIFLTHTEVPGELEGKGVGFTLVDAVLKEVERLQLPMVPLCPFVAAYIKRHPEWKGLLQKELT
jgi:predicted GNAT family acetyltransferase